MKQKNAKNMKILKSWKAVFIKRKGNLILLLLLSFMFSMSCFATLIKDYGFRIAFASSLLFYLPSVALFSVIPVIGEALGPGIGGRRRNGEDITNAFTKKHAAIITAVIFLCWLPVFLIYYPGCASTDTIDILKMVTGMDFYSTHFRYTTINNHHPLLYTLFIKAFVSLGRMLGISLAGSTAMAAVCQMLLLSLGISCLLCTIYNRTRSRAVFCAAFVFFLCNPLLAKLSATLWKDILFLAAVMILYSLSVQYLLNDDCRPGPGRLILIGVFALLTMLLRNGGVIIPVLFLGAAGVLKKGNRKRSLCCLMAALCLYIVITGPVYKIAGVAPGHFSEGISVPLQQLARVVKQNGRMSAEEKEFLNRILPLEDFKRNYEEKSANRLKFCEHFDDEFLENNKMQFFKVWIQVGLKNPRKYLVAWINETKGFWHISTLSRTFSSSAGFQLDDDQKNTARNLIPFIPLKAYDSALSIYVFMSRPLTSSAFLGWFIAAICAGAVFLRSSNAFIVTLPLAAWWMVFVLNSPIYQQFRYTLPLYGLFPLALAVLFFENAGTQKYSDGLQEEIV